MRPFCQWHRFSSRTTLRSSRRWFCMAPRYAFGGAVISTAQRLGVPILVRVFSGPVSVPSVRCDAESAAKQRVLVAYVDASDASIPPDGHQLYSPRAMAQRLQCLLQTVPFKQFVSPQVAPILRSNLWGVGLPSPRSIELFCILLDERGHPLHGWYPCDYADTSLSRRMHDGALECRNSEFMTRFIELCYSETIDDSSGRELTNDVISVSYSCSDAEPNTNVALVGDRPPRTSKRRQPSTGCTISDARYAHTMTSMWSFYHWGGLPLPLHTHVAEWQHTRKLDVLELGFDAAWSALISNITRTIPVRITNLDITEDGGSTVSSETFIGSHFPMIAISVNSIWKTAAQLSPKSSRILTPALKHLLGAIATETPIGMSNGNQRVHEELVILSPSDATERIDVTMQAGLDAGVLILRSITNTSNWFVDRAHMSDLTVIFRIAVLCWLDAMAASSVVSRRLGAGSEVVMAKHRQSRPSTTAFFDALEGFLASSRVSIDMAVSDARRLPPSEQLVFADFFTALACCCTVQVTSPAWRAWSAVAVSASSATANEEYWLSSDVKRDTRHDVLLPIRALHTAALLQSATLCATGSSGSGPLADYYLRLSAELRGPVRDFYDMAQSVAKYGLSNMFGFHKEMTVFVAPDACAAREEGFQITLDLGAGRRNDRTNHTQITHEIKRSSPPVALPQSERDNVKKILSATRSVMRIGSSTHTPTVFRQEIEDEAYRTIQNPVNHTYFSTKIADECGAGILAIGALCSPWFNTVRTTMNRRVANQFPASLVRDVFVSARRVLLAECTGASLSSSLSYVSECGSEPSIGTEEDPAGLASQFWKDVEAGAALGAVNSSQSVLCLCFRGSSTGFATDSMSNVAHLASVVRRSFLPVLLAVDTQRLTAKTSSSLSKLVDECRSTLSSFADEREDENTTQFRIDAEQEGTEQGGPTSDIRLLGTILEELTLLNPSIHGNDSNALLLKKLQLSAFAISMTSRSRSADVGAHLGQWLLDGAPAEIAVVFKGPYLIPYVASTREELAAHLLT